MQAHSHYVNCCAFSKDATYILSGSEDLTLKIFLTQTKQQSRKSYTAHTKLINGIKVHQQSKKIVTASWDKVTFLFAKQKNMLMFVFPVDKTVDNCRR